MQQTPGTKNASFIAFTCKKQQHYNISEVRNERSPLPLPKAVSLGVEAGSKDNVSLDHVGGSLHLGV